MFMKKKRAGDVRSPCEVPHGRWKARKRLFLSGHCPHIAHAIVLYDC